jgi:hypothetical protein
MHGIKKLRKPKPEGAWSKPSMLSASHFDDPEYWRQRAEEARLLAELMFSVAEDCDELAVKAAIRPMDETKRS